MANSSLKDRKPRKTELSPGDRRDRSKGSKPVVIVLLGIVAILIVFGLLKSLDASREEENVSDGPVILPVDDSMTFEFSLTSSGKHAVALTPGDVFTVSYKIYRTDKDADFQIYAVQNEIEFDPEIFELIEDSISCGYTTSIHSYDNGRCRIYMNAFSPSPSGFKYIQGAEFGSFSLKISDNATPGSYEITSNNCKITDQGGQSLYKSTVKNVTVEINN